MVRGISPSPGASASRIGVETLDRRGRAADHHAVAALEPPHAAGRAHVDIVELPLGQRLGAPDVVPVEAVAAVDDHVAGLEQGRERLHRLLGDLARRQHHPHRARPVELGHQIVQAGGPDRTLGGQLLHGLRLRVVDDAGVTMQLQAAHDVASHAAEPDHAQLHLVVPP